MYAIVQAGGRQHRVTPGGHVIIDGTAGEPGAEVTLDQVLLIEKDGGDVIALRLAGGRVYLTSADGALRIVDIHDPSQPVLLGT